VPLLAPLVVSRLHGEEQHLYRVDTKIMKSKCERVAPLSPEHQHMGLTGSELLGALATEGATNLMERKMDDKMMGVVRHILTAVGAIVTYMGWTDDATWVTVMGSLMTMIPFMWSWVSK
jgi:hypothetical protein